MIACWELKSVSAMIVAHECSWDMEFTIESGVDVTHALSFRGLHAQCDQQY